MTVFRIDVSKESGAVILLMETPCGMRPIIGWSNLKGVKEFGQMLLDFYDGREEALSSIEESTENLLRQALGDAEWFGKQDD